MDGGMVLGGGRVGGRGGGAGGGGLDGREGDGGDFCGGMGGPVGVGGDVGCDDVVVCEEEVEWGVEGGGEWVLRGAVLLISWISLTRCTMINISYACSVVHQAMHCHIWEKGWCVWAHLPTEQCFRVIQYLL